MHASYREDGFFHCFVKTLTVGEFAHCQNFINHFLLTFLIVRRHGVLKTSVEVAFEQHLMGGFEQADDGKILLHQVNAVGPVIEHADDFVDVAGSFLEISQGGQVAWIHRFISLRLIIPIPVVGVVVLVYFASVRPSRAGVDKSLCL